MTFGFAPEPAGLGMHRIWVGVPEKNTRSISVYQSLGFMPSGTSRDALWDAENNKYQDLIVMDTLADEYDPIASLDAFGMHVLEDNPGVKEALSMREHSVSIRKRNAEEQQTRPVIPEEAKAPMPQPGEEPGESQRQEHIPPEQPEPRATQRYREPETGDVRESSDGEESSWPYGSSERKSSKTAWWRNLGRGRKRDMEGK